MISSPILQKALFHLNELIMLRCLFKQDKKKSVQKTNYPLASATLLKDEIEQTFDTIKETCIEYLSEKKGDFGGYTDTEICSLENEYKVEFPKAYKLFLKKFVGGELKIFDGQAYDMKGISEAQTTSIELILQNKATLPNNYFAFSQWQGYQFYYFINDGSDNPETFLYLEGGSNTSQHPAQIYPQGSFTNWLISLSISYMELIGRVQGYKAEEGIRKLKSILIQSRSGEGEV